MNNLKPKLAAMLRRWAARLAPAEVPKFKPRGIKNRDERIWLAAIIDGEGCIFINKRKAGQHSGKGYARQSDLFGAGLQVGNTCRAIVERCKTITGKGSISLRKPGDDLRRKQTLYSWACTARSARIVLRAVYPHLVAKQHQARLAIGCPSRGEEAARAHAGLKALHGGHDPRIDFSEPVPGYVEFEPGKGVCQRGHNLALPDAKCSNGSCRECKRVSDARRYTGAGNTTKVRRRMARESRRKNRR